MIKKIILLFITLACFIQPVYSQRTGLDLLGTEPSIEIPFSQSNGLLLVELKMNGIPLTFMYDTGAENTILFKKEIAYLLGLQSTRRIKIIGSDLSSSIFGFIVHNVNFKFSKKIERDESIIVLEENVYKIQESTGHRIDGLLGGNFFRNTVIKIDYKKKKIIVSHPTKFSFNLSGYTEVPVRFHDQKPYLLASLHNYNDTNKEIVLLVDTGSSIPFIIHTNVDPSLEAPDHLMRGILGIGLSGTLIGLIGIIKQLEFSGFRFDELLTNFQDLNESILQQKDIIRHGILGNAFLNRFTIVIDYFHRRMYFKPHRNYNKAFKYDKSGLVIIASGLDFNQYFIQTVIPGSPAAKAGLQKGDRLLSLQRIPVSFRTLDNVQGYFKKKAGKEIRLKISRSGEKIVYRFKLEDLLKGKISILTKPYPSIPFDEIAGFKGLSLLHE